MAIKTHCLDIHPEVMYNDWNGLRSINPCWPLTCLATRRSELWLGALGVQSEAKACARRPRVWNDIQTASSQDPHVHAPQVERCEAVMSDGYLVTPVWGPRDCCLMAPLSAPVSVSPANGLEEDNARTARPALCRDSSGLARGLRTWAHTHGRLPPR